MTITRIRHIIAVVVLCAFLAPVAAEGGLIASEDGDLSWGMPMGAEVEGADLDLCPRGVDTVGRFLYAWERDDYKTMYNLLDDESKKDYPLEDAKFDFMFLEFKEYRISSIRRQGKDFEFILSHGDWKSGDKETKKMIISGESFKVIMPTKNSPFKESVESYF